MCQYLSVDTHAGDRRYPSLLDVAQAARLSGLNEQTIRAYLRKGVIRGQKGPANTYVIRRDQLLIDLARRQGRP